MEYPVIIIGTRLAVSLGRGKKWTRLIWSCLCRIQCHGFDRKFYSAEFRDEGQEEDDHRQTDYPLTD